MSQTDPIFPTTSNSGSGRSGTAVSIAERIDLATKRFEEAWQSGKRPQLEEFLAEFEDYEQPALLFELLRIEAKRRVDAGEKPTTQEYLLRFPKQESALRRALLETIREESETMPPSGDKAKPFESETGASKSGKSGSSSTELATDAYVTRTIQKAPQKPNDSEAAFTAAKYIELAHHDSGGLGDVFRGRDEELGRDVAIKAIQKRLINNPMVTDQFNVEVKVTSRLDHPGIVPVYGMGKFPDGRHFFVMRFIDGVNFRTAIKEFHATDWKKRTKAEYRTELNRLLEHFCAACHTIAYAHNRGIVHRDIKPQNIMLGRFHETLVVDWGLAVPVQRDARAKASGEKTVMPQMGTESGSTSGGTAGTLGYMSPEQFQDAEAPLGPQSDIYSLGATLYHLLTGSAPHQGSSLTETSKVIRTGDFPPPTRINRSAPKALEAICLKAMALKPADRYVNAEEMSKDVTNWMTGEQVSVFKEPLIERLLRVAQQNRNWTTVLAVACAVLFGAAVLSSIWMTQAAKSEALMRTKADELRNESLKQSAMFAARVIEGNIDRRWRTLGLYAQDPDLPKLIADCQGAEPGSPEFEAMHRWITDAWLEVQEKERDTTWFVTDASGRQLGRYPKGTSVGKNYAHRDYFHGKGTDLSVEEGKGSKPVERPWISNVYLSDVRGSGYRIGFSVPVYKNGRPHAGEQPIAVLAMSVKASAFQVLSNAVLIDLRSDVIAGSEKKGLIIYHNKLPSLMEKSENPEPPRLDRQRLNELIEAKSELLSASDSSNASSSGGTKTSKILPDYVDPVEPDRKGIAAFAPVVIRRDGPGADAETPWIVIVPQETETLKP